MEKLMIKKIEPTFFLKREIRGLKQLFVITVENPGAYCHAELLLFQDMNEVYSESLSLPEGVSRHEIYFDEPVRTCELACILKSSGAVQDRSIVKVQPPKHWVVHVVQLSHHDPGYTDLPSLVLREHDRHLAAAIDMAEATKEYPEDARFRIVIEQAWSADHFLKHTDAQKAKKFIQLLREGRFELTALFGNMTTEICGHEGIYRALYHSARFKRKYGVPIVSAEHNDITGISWGLSRVLTDAGIKIFCPGLPLYYNWGNYGLQSFWDEEKIFGGKGPGAFWWEAPSGKRLLFWCNNHGCGGENRGTLPELPGKLQELEKNGYPYSVLRWPVGGAMRDNAPYIPDYAETIREWNAKWEYPRLVCSTNALFYRDFIRELPEELPIHRGELAGQDYPVASTSTAAPTAQNKNNHHALVTAEKLSSAAAVAVHHPYPQDTLFEACEEMLWYDEHAWGYHFPCGPAMKASEMEKALRAYRSAALTHGAVNKAMAAIADNIAKEHEGISLVVFNPSPFAKSGVVRTPLRELDNSGSTIMRVAPGKDPQGTGFLKGVLLNERWHVNPALELVNGEFDLVDAATGKKIAFQIIGIETAADTVPYAAERLGLGSGTRRYGFFEEPLGLKKDLCFIEEGIPANGYKTYYLVPNKAASSSAAGVWCGEGWIENEFYRVETEAGTGEIRSVLDKKSGRELLDRACGCGLGTVIVRERNSPVQLHWKSCGARLKTAGPLCAALEIKGEVLGHPAVTLTVTLYAGVRQVYLETRIMKDATPLLNMHILFPFAVEKPVFRYEGALCVMEPIRDYLPGSYSDAIAVQNWVKVSGDGFHLLWSSLDAPIAALGGLWPGYTSPAHRCIVEECIKHPPLQPEELKKGWIGSQVFSNNYGTNFSVSQVGDVLFRYVFASAEGEGDDAEAARFGWRNAVPFEQIFTDRNKGKDLPVSDTMLELSNDRIVLLNWKEAEDGKGYCLRLWNMSRDEQEVCVRIKGMEVKKAVLTDPGETEEYQALRQEGDAFFARFGGQEIAAVRVERQETECT